MDNFSCYSVVFNRLYLCPDHGFLLQNMPNVSVDSGHRLTDLILDATEFKFQYATNYELNSLMFSHYKNTATGKALLGIAPHGMGVVFSDIYPGSISDTDITEKAEVLEYVTEEHEIMTAEVSQSTITHKNIETNDNFYRKVAFLMYTEMVNFRPQS